jgi:hypothetical protein
LENRAEQPQRGPQSQLKSGLETTVSQIAKPTHKLSFARDQNIHHCFHNRRGTATQRKPDIKTYEKSEREPAGPHQDRDINEPACPSNTAKNEQPGSSGMSATAVCASSILDLQPCICDTAYDTVPPAPASESFFVMGVCHHTTDDVNPKNRRNDNGQHHNGSGKYDTQVTSNRKRRGNGVLPAVERLNEPQGRRPYKRSCKGSRVIFRHLFPNATVQGTAKKDVLIGRPCFVLT